MILDGRQFSEELFDSIDNCKNTFSAFSAFIKLRALKDNRFSENLAERDVLVVARWQKHDLLCGASDLGVYQFCKEQGWRFGIDLNLHGKLFLVDNNIFLGSANLTQRGFHLGLIGNHEFGTKMLADRADLSKIENFVNSEVALMDDKLFKLIEKEIGDAEEEKIDIFSTSWSDTIIEIVKKPVEYLWVQELVFSTPNELLSPDFNDEKTIHDYELLGLDIDFVQVDSLKRAFKRLRVYKWITSVLSNGCLSFGGVSARLHLAILDDPKPYRVDIKSYNKIIFEWAEFIDDVFEITRPNYSQVLRLR